MAVLDLQPTTDGQGGFAPPGEFGDVGAGGNVTGIHGAEAAAVTVGADNDDIDLRDDAHALIVPIDFAGFELRGLLAPEVPGEVKKLRAVSAGTIPHEAATSTAANRFLCPDDTDMDVPIDAMVEVVYLETEARWQVTGSSAGGAGGGGGSGLDGMDG